MNWIGLTWLKQTLNWNTEQCWHPGGLPGTSLIHQPRQFWPQLLSCCLWSCYCSSCCLVSCQCCHGRKAAFLTWLVPWLDLLGAFVILLSREAMIWFFVLVSVTRQWPKPDYLIFFNTKLVQMQLNRLHWSGTEGYISGAPFASWLHHIQCLRHTSTLKSVIRCVVVAPSGKALQLL